MLVWHFTSKICEKNQKIIIFFTQLLLVFRLQGIFLNLLVILQQLQVKSKYWIMKAALVKLQQVGLQSFVTVNCERVVVLNLGL